MINWYKLRRDPLSFVAIWTAVLVGIGIGRELGAETWSVYGGLLPVRS